MSNRLMSALLAAALMIAIGVGISLKKSNSTDESDITLRSQSSQHRRLEGIVASDARGGKEIQGHGRPRTPIQVLSHEDLGKLALLEEVLETRTFDTDSRVDTELKNISPALKAALAQKFSTLPAEKLNQRGSIVFLIGRSASAPSDFHFLTEVAGSPACLSLRNCTHSEPSEGAHASGSSGESTTLRYPQWVALQELREQASNEHLAEPLREQARQSLREIARTAADPLVQRRARALIETL